MVEKIVPSFDELESVIVFSEPHSQMFCEKYVPNSIVGLVATGRKLKVWCYEKVRYIRCLLL